MALNTKLLENIRLVEPYTPGEQPQNKVIKLNTNENPYPPAPGVERVLKDMDTDRFRLYPDPTSDILISELADTYGVSKDQVFVGVGSDDVISMSFLTFFNSGKPILFPDVTYSFYKVWASLYRIPYECPKLDDNFRIRREDYYVENGGIIFPNPNAPTAIYEGLDFVEDILQHNPDVVVIVDEAYIDFAGDNASALQLLEKYDNLLVVQTFSKARSMAGMRIGYAIGHPELIKYLNDAKYSFNSYTMTQTSLVCGTESLKDKNYFADTVGKIIAAREWTKDALEKLGFISTDSKANFLFVTHPEYNAKEIFEALKANDIYVRYWNSERISQHLRVTIGTQEEMESLIEFLKKYMCKE